MHKKHIFLRVFQKITIFACVFCVCSALAETTTCDINYTPVTGNSIQNVTPTPTTPVAIESIGTKVGNKYQISVTAQGKNLFDSSKSSSIKNITRDGETFTSTVMANTGDYIITWLDNTRVSNHTPIVTGNRSYYTITKDSSFNYISVGWLGVSDSYMKYDVSDIADNTTITVSFELVQERTSSQNGIFKNVQIEEGSEATPYEPYGHSTTPIYLNAPLRKVGNYADVLDYKNGTITRNVGVKVLDGTEDWDYNNIRFSMILSDAPVSDMNIAVCSHYKNVIGTITVADMDNQTFKLNNRQRQLIFKDSSFTTLSAWTTFLATQYAAGTPVIVYYPLATPVVEQIENWSCTPPITDIQIATTKMVDEEFAQAEANLATTVQTIESVVSRTIAQTGQIQVLQDTKQTRPDESCPANMKCLLVQDEDGTPHWYPIIEP